MYLLYRSEYFNFLLYPFSDCPHPAQNDRRQLVSRGYSYGGQLHDAALPNFQWFGNHMPGNQY